MYPGSKGSTIITLIISIAFVIAGVFFMLKTTVFNDSEEKAQRCTAQTTGTYSNVTTYYDEDSGTDYSADLTFDAGGQKVTYLH